LKKKTDLVRIHCYWTASDCLPDRQAEIAPSNDVRCAGTDLTGREELGANEPDHRHLADRQLPRDLVQRQLATFGSLALAVNRDTVVAAPTA